MMVIGDWIYYSTYIDEKDHLKGVSKVENKSLDTILYRISSDGKTQSAKFHGATINSCIVRNKIYYYTEDSVLSGWEFHGMGEDNMLKK